MGCGSSSSKINHFYNCNLYCLNIDDNEMIKKSAAIIKKCEETFKIVENKNILEYLKSSVQKDFKILLENKPSSILEYFIFILKYHGRNSKILKSNEIYDLIPYDEMMIINKKNTNLLEKVSIIDMQNLKLYFHFLSPYEIINNMISSIDLNDENFDLINLKFDFEKYFIQQDINESNLIKKYEEEINEGSSLQIFEELTYKNINLYLDKIKNEKIVSLHIRRNQFQDLSLFQQILDALSDSKYLHSFNFNDNLNTTGFDYGWKIITNFLNKNDSIRNLNLCMAFLYDKNVINLIEEGISYKKIINLDLSLNFITQVGCKYIAEWLKNNKIIKKVNLQQNATNEFKKEGSDLIVSVLTNHTRINYFDISNMNLTGFGEKLSEFIKLTKSLEILKIQNTRMNIDDFKFISDALCENTTITDLNLSENDCGNDSSIQIISKFISSNKNIRILNIFNLGIKKENNQTLIEAIKHNEVIENYFLGDRKFKFSNFYDVMLNKTCLKYLQINIYKNSKNYLGDINLIENLKKEKNNIVLNII